jgi:hypothetical protein
VVQIDGSTIVPIFFTDPLQRSLLYTAIRRKRAQKGAKGRNSAQMAQFGATRRKRAQLGAKGRNSAQTGAIRRKRAQPGAL